MQDLLRALNNSGFQDMSQLYEFNILMKRNKIILIYEGDFSQEVAKSVLNMTEKNLATQQVEEMTKRKIYNVMIESLQNICKHTTNFNNSRSLFMIGFDGSHFNIVSGNPCSNERVQNIKDRLDHINSLDEEGLKQHFKQVRLNSTISEVGGAGLGFIDMAKRTGNKIHYQFESMDETHSFFTLMVQVSNN